MDESIKIASWREFASTFHRRVWTLNWTFTAHTPPEVEGGSYLGDASDDEVSHFGVIPRFDSVDANELVNPFDGPSYGRYHGFLIDKSSVTTALGSSLNTVSTIKKNAPHVSMRRCDRFSWKG